ncbi:MAG: hypothetical protein ABIO79_05240 [Ferruginibacter sp.]
MKKYKIYKILFLLIPAFNIYTIQAQENTTENKTVRIKKDVVCQIDFSTQVEAGFTLPKSSTDFYDMEYTRGNRSVQITTSKETLPPTILTVKETSGKTWNISIEYKEDLDPDNEDETNYNFSDGNSTSAKNNIILKETDLKLDLEKQTSANAYSISEMGQLQKNYPQLVFTEPPPEQTINLACKDNDGAFIAKLYNSSPGLNQAFKSDMVNIRIVCQNISFNGTNAYLKLLLQNDGTEAFLTGVMLLTLVRQNGPSLRLHPCSIYPATFPIVKPKSEIALIYTFKDFDLSDDENLKFEIQDRLQKINLEFKIPGSAYYSAKKD